MSSFLSLYPYKRKKCLDHEPHLPSYTVHHCHLLWVAIINVTPKLLLVNRQNLKLCACSTTRHHRGVGHALSKPHSTTPKFGSL